MRIFVGILLMVGAFVVLFGIIVIPVLPPTEDSAAVNNYLTPLLCQPGEHLIREQYQTEDSDGTSYSMTPYCVNSERQREDVTGRWMLIGGGGFAILFLLGLVITIVSAARRQQEWLQTLPNHDGSSTDSAVFRSINNAKTVGFGDGTIKVNGFEIKLDGLTQDKINALKSQMRTGMGGGNLTTKLKQLQEAKDNGLISGDEYDRLRQKILDDVM